MRHLYLLLLSMVLFTDTAFAAGSGIGVLGWMFILGWVVVAAGVGIFVYLSAEVGTPVLMAGFAMIVPYLVVASFKTASIEQPKPNAPLRAKLLSSFSTFHHTDQLPSALETHG